MILAAVIAGLVTLGALGLAAWCIFLFARSQETQQMMALGQLREFSLAALDAVKAKDLGQLVAAESSRKNVDVGIQYLRNQFDTQRHQEAEKKKQEEPVLAKGTNAEGEEVEINLNEYETFG